MVSLSSVTLAIMFAVISTFCNGSSARCFGCSINGDKGTLAVRSVDDPRTLNPLFTNHRLSIFKRKPRMSKGSSFNHVKIQNFGDEKTGLAQPFSNTKDNKLSGITFLSKQMSRNNGGNPFLRVKRDVCQNPASLPQAVSQLNGALNAIQFIGLIPTSSPRADIPSGQPDKCPNFPADKWWPGYTDNLRSTCPWVYVEKDLGVDAYPRYIREANCLCDSCIGSTGLGCLDVKQTFTYFIIQSCQNGLALMNQVNTTITVGCHCSDAMPPTTVSPAPTPRVIPTNDYY